MFIICHSIFVTPTCWARPRHDNCLHYGTQIVLPGNTIYSYIRGDIDGTPVTPSGHPRRGTRTKVLTRVFLVIPFWQTAGQCLTQLTTIAWPVPSTILVIDDRKIGRSVASDISQAQRNCGCSDVIVYRVMVRPDWKHDTELSLFYLTIIACHLLSTSLSYLRSKLPATRTHTHGRKWQATFAT